MTERRALAAVLLLAGCALVFQAWWLSLTADEPSHMLSSYLYWRGRDRLYPRDMPPLIKIAGGWPTLFMKLPVDPDLGAPGDKRSEWMEAASLINSLPPEKLQRFVFWSRLPLIVFPLLTSWLLWRWGRELFGSRVGVLIAALWAFSPVPLGHGALFKNDHAAAFTYLLFWYVAGRYWRRPDIRTAALLGCAGALAAMSKLSMLFVPVLAPLVVLVRARSPLQTASAIAVPYLALLTAWQFDLHWTSPAELATLAADPAFPVWFVSAAHLFRVLPLPEGLWIGVVSLFKSNDAMVPVYMLGQVYPEGHRLYFLLATILKMPFPLWIAAGAGLWLAIRQRVSAFVIVPGLLYFVLASVSSLQLGARLVLPAWAMFMLLAGVALERLLRRRAGQAVVAAGAAVVIAGAVSSYPNGIAYFNSFAGRPHENLQLLADSNIDWGQGLRDAASWATAKGIRQLRVSYFGFDQPRRFFRDVRIEMIAPPWNERVAKGQELQPEPGWYAISGSLLPGHFFQPQYRDYYRAFRHRVPEAVAGSIFFYRVNPPLR